MEDQERELRLEALRMAWAVNPNPNEKPTDFVETILSDADKIYEWIKKAK